MACCPRASHWTYRFRFSSEYLVLIDFGCGSSEMGPDHSRDSVILVVLMLVSKLKQNSRALDMGSSRTSRMHMHTAKMIQYVLRDDLHPDVIIPRTDAHRAARGIQATDVPEETDNPSLQHKCNHLTSSGQKEEISPKYRSRFTDAV